LTRPFPDVILQGRRYQHCKSCRFTYWRPLPQ
jgi:hypothetical protein